jgi:hypothetical protein
MTILLINAVVYHDVLLNKMVWILFKLMSIINVMRVIYILTKKKKKNGYPCHLKLLIVTYDYPRKCVIINRVTLFIAILIRMLFPSMRYIVKFDVRLLLNSPYDVIMFLYIVI